MRRALFVIMLYSLGFSTPFSLDSIINKLSLVAQHDYADHSWAEGVYYIGKLEASLISPLHSFRQDVDSWAASHGYTINDTDYDKDWFLADNQTPGQVYLGIYLTDSEPKDSKKYVTFKGRIDSLERYADRVISQFEYYKDQQWWWIDGTFMAGAIFPQLYQITGNTYYLELLDRFYWSMYDALYSPEDSLFARDIRYIPGSGEKKEFTVTDNGSRVFWSRGNGWGIGALARILKYLPDTWPTYSRYLNLYKALSYKLKSLQCADGYWRASLYDSAETPKPETSGTALHCFGLAWGVNRGILNPDDFVPAINAAWEALYASVTKDSGSNSASLTKVQGPASRPKQSENYGTINYGNGAFLLAGSEVWKMLAVPPVAAATNHRLRLSGAHTDYFIRKVVFNRDRHLRGNPAYSVLGRRLGSKFPTGTTIQILKKTADSD